MNIILVSSHTSRARHVTLTHRHVLVMALVGAVFLPAMAGFFAFKVQGLLNRYNGATDAQALASQERELIELRTKVESAKESTGTHLNALAQRMGSMQAQLLRLDGLGERLTRMAGLDGKEFDFGSLPAVGGPERTASVTAEKGSVLETLDQLVDEIDLKQKQLDALETLLLDKQLTAAVTPSGWPTKGGWVSSHFGIRADPFTGKRAHHKGVDIASPFGSHIMAMADGVVTHAGLKSGYGSMVEINHGQGYLTRYAHASEVLVKVGDRISKAQIIAKVGSSGRSTGPHLHFEVIKNGLTHDPISYLRGPKR